MSKEYIKAQTPLPAYFPYPKFLLQMSLSHTARLTYVLLLDRMTLSQKNGWVDVQGRAYVLYPLAGLAEDLQSSISSVTRALRELEAARLIERRSNGFSKPNQGKTRRLDYRSKAGIDIPALGTTQADYFYGDIPCARELTKGEVESDYEANTGKVIVETIENRRLDPIAVPGIVVKNHGPFAWGKSPENAVYNAVVMEKVAEMDLKTLMLNPNAEMKQYVLDKHYMRKHGPNAYYGQK